MHCLLNIFEEVKSYKLGCVTVPVARSVVIKPSRTFDFAIMLCFVCLQVKLKCEEGGGDRCISVAVIRA